MATETIAELFVQALHLGDARTFDELAGALAADVTFVSAVSAPTSGPTDVIALLKAFQSAGRFARTTAWESHAYAAGLRVAAELPLDSFYAKYVWDMALGADGQIEKIVQTGIANTEPLPPAPIHLTDDISTALRLARESRNPVIVAYIDHEGRPSQAPRGTVQVFSDTQLAMWVHNPRGGLIAAIRTNANVSLHYWGGIGTAFGGALLFQGVAHINDDEATRSNIYENSPASEQRSDPDRHGRALIVDLKRVSGFVAGTRYNMTSELE